MQRKLAAIVLAATVAVACSGRAATPGPAPTYTPYPTYTLLPTRDLLPTYTPYPTDTLSPGPGLRATANGAIAADVTDAGLKAGGDSSIGVAGETSTPLATSSPVSVTTGEATVVDVLDGDTIDVSMGGEVYRVRYIGVHTPEWNEPGYAEAKALNAQMVVGKQVRLERDISEVDRYGRLLRYVYVADLFVNAELVKRGRARAAAYPPDVSHAEEFSRLQVEAQEAGRGLWATGGGTREVQAPNPCAYVGNSRSKVFHHASCDSVENMADHNKVCFATREEAIVAGHRPCKRCNP